MAPVGVPGLGRGSRSFPGGEAGWGLCLVVSRTDALSTGPELVAGSFAGGRLPFQNASQQESVVDGQTRPPGHESPGRGGETGPAGA